MEIGDNFDPVLKFFRDRVLEPNSVDWLTIISLFTQINDRSDDCNCDSRDNGVYVCEYAACECFPLGSNPNGNGWNSDGPPGVISCDKVTGLCPCLPNVVGRHCEQCLDDHWNIVSGTGKCLSLLPTDLHFCFAHAMRGHLICVLWLKPVSFSELHGISSLRNTSYEPPFSYIMRSIIDLYEKKLLIS